MSGLKLKVMMINNFVGISLSPIREVEELHERGIFKSLSSSQAEEKISETLAKYQWLKRFPGVELRDWLIKNGANSSQLAKMRKIILILPEKEQEAILVGRRGYFSSTPAYYSGACESPDLDEILKRLEGKE